MKKIALAAVAVLALGSSAFAGSLGYNTDSTGKPLPTAAFAEWVSIHAVVPPIHAEGVCPTDDHSDIARLCNFTNAWGQFGGGGTN